MTARLQEPATGSPGPGGPDTYTHEQDVASDTWVVIHNLGFKPAVTVVDTIDRTFEGSVAYDSNDQLTITFGAPFTGKAYLS